MRFALFTIFVALLPLPVFADDPIFPEGAKLKVEAEKGVGGEGPAWDAKLGILTSGNGNINRLVTPRGFRRCRFRFRMLPMRASG